MSGTNGDRTGTPPGPARVTDPTLLDELARLTPEERLRRNDRIATTILELRHGFAAREPDDPARAARRERN